MVMHPGPLNAGVEITSEAMRDLEEDKNIHLAINEQVESGIVVRAALMYYLLGEG